MAVRAVIVLLCFAGAQACASRPALEEIAHLDTPGWAHDVVPEGGSTYVADFQGGLVTCRLSPARIEAVAAPVKELLALALRPGEMLLAARFEGVVRISNAGRVLARVAGGDIANAVAVRGDLVYAAYGKRGLVIAGLEDGRILSELPTPGWSHDVKLVGDIALLADFEYGLRAVEIRDPAHPAEIGVLPTNATTLCIAPGGGRHAGVIATSEGHGGVRFVRLDGRGVPTAVSGLSLGLDPADRPHPASGGWAHGLSWCGDWVFLANWKRGLAVIDARDVTRPRVVLEEPTRGTAVGVAAEAQTDGTFLVFLADGEAGLRILRLRVRPSFLD